MFEHVAMDKPQSRIVGDKNKVGFFATSKEVRISLSVKESAVFLLDPKVVTVQMHRVIPARVIPDFDTDGLPDIDLG